MVTLGCSGDNKLSCPKLSFVFKEPTSDWNFEPIEPAIFDMSDGKAEAEVEEAVESGL